MNQNNFYNLINPLAIEVCQQLNNRQYQAFIVGGCVRDLLLKQLPKDYDITTDAHPYKIIEFFPKTIPTGIRHGTITVCMDDNPKNHFEVTTFRIEGDYSDGRRPDEVFFVMNVEQDLARRDLTINAIAYDPLSKTLIDPFDGIQDLENQLIKAVGNPTIRFQEDGLRIMRVARFAARFGYAVDKPTFDAMSKNLDTLKKVSKERINDELIKILMSDNPSYGLQLLKNCGALDIICPLLANKHLPFIYHQDKCQGPLSTRLAFLYNKQPPEQVQQELINLKFSNKEIKKTVFLLQLMDKFEIFAIKDTPSAYKSFMAVIKNHSHERWQETQKQFITLMGALQIDILSLLDKYTSEVVFSRKEMNINGDDLLAAGIPAGPRIKQALDECYLEILKCPEHNTKYRLLEIARQF